MKHARASYETANRTAKGIIRGKVLVLIDHLERMTGHKSILAHKLLAGHDSKEYFRLGM